ncbi:MAG: FHA domain-containing protein [Gemmatimonadaceae bacterium]
MTVLLVAMLVISVGAVVPYLVGRHRDSRAMLRRDPPPLVFPMTRGDWQAEPLEAGISSFADPIAPREEIYSFADPMAPHEGMSTDRSPLSSDTVQFRRPANEALQVLPGRLEVLSGVDSPREIRFVRFPGEPPQLIIGRDPGSSPQHVALPSSTVSRRHARFDFFGGQWRLANLSSTNPVVVNDETLSNIDGERFLMDGDRIELGDVQLRFHAH